MPAARARTVGVALAALTGALALVWLSGDPGTESPPAAGAAAAEVGDAPAPVETSGMGPLDSVDPVGREGLEAPPPEARWRDSDHAPQAPRPPRAGSEKALHAAFLEQARTDPVAFRKRWAELLHDGTQAEKAAALRAWYDAGLEPRYGAFAEVLAAPGSETELREFALRFLGGKAQVDGPARQALTDYLLGGAADVRGRYLAVYPVLRWGDDREVGACTAMLFAEQEPRIVARAAEALQLSSARNAPFVLRDLRNGHPRADVRAALKE